MVNAKICSNCRESYDASLNKCPKCGFSSETKNESNNFNMRNPFLELANGGLAASPASANTTAPTSGFNNSMTNDAPSSSSNNSFLLNSNESFSSFMSHNSATTVPEAPSMLTQNNDNNAKQETTNAQITNENTSSAVSNFNPAEHINPALEFGNNNLSNTFEQPNNAALEIPSTPNQINNSNENNNNISNPFEVPNNNAPDLASTPVQTNNEQQNPASNNILENQMNNMQNNKAFEPFVDNKKYEVGGIDFNSFFNNKSNEENKEQATVPVTEQTTVSLTEPLTTPMTSEPPMAAPSNNQPALTPQENNQELNVLSKGYNPSLDFEKNRLAMLREEEKKKEMMAQEAQKNSVQKDNKLNEKLIEYYKYDFFFLSFITMAILVLSCLTNFSIIILVHGIIDIVLMVIGYNFAYDKDPKAGYVGIAVSLLLIANIIYGDYINVVIGVLILVHSAFYMLNFKKKTT